MRSDPVKVGFSDEEMKALIEILNYSLDYCPIEGISHGVSITRNKIQDLIAKLENGLK